MKSLDRIPTNKIDRASKLIGTGAKLGANYIKYYGQRLVGNEQNAKERLDESNAEDIYNSLKQLKGSALKVAQMLSMEKNLLPKSYVDKFALSQFSVPPLSGPLVVKTFKKYFGKSPLELFDEFDINATNAASIGQVHKAVVKGQTLAIKIQYPGVADSITSDLAMVKPIALKMLNISAKDSEKYFKEVEQKLFEETDYLNELKQSQEVSIACAHLPNIKFPQYYPEYSCDKIIAMDWMTGLHLSEFTTTQYSDQTANQIGQSLWDFYMHQIHRLKKVHADPHPGNFLIDPQHNLIVLDFGCMKIIPESFYTPYFEISQRETLNNPVLFEQKLYELEILNPKDSAKEKAFFTHLFYQMFDLFIQPFENEYFDFSNAAFFENIAYLTQSLANDPEIRKFNSNRGSEHFIYLNRSFIGLYNLMHDLRATNIKINHYLEL